MTRSLYNFLWKLARLVIPVRLWLRSFRNKAYLDRWDERFVRTLPPAATAGSRLAWVHAVSVGEVNAATPFVRQLLESQPDLEILITTSTPTGSDQLRRVFAHELGTRIKHVYSPYDVPADIERFLDAARPVIALFMETEIWPNWLQALGDRSIPAMLINARMSEKSARGYARVRGLSLPAISGFARIGAQTESDAERLRQLGATDGALSVTGSIKYDIELDEQVAARARELRQLIGHRPVWIAGSTREGEEIAVFQAHAKIRMDREDILLIIVPRHPERFELVSRMSMVRGNITNRRSENEPEELIKASVYVGDTMGELGMLYAVADVAFVGGSLVETGGQNVLEAIAAGRPAVFGPHTWNFAEICQQVEKTGAGFRVEDGIELADRMIELLNNPEACREAAAAGAQLMEENRGATERLVAMARQLL